MRARATKTLSPEPLPDLPESAWAFIRELVGDVKVEHQHFVEIFLGEKMAVFIPTGKYCRYAITMHSHPSPRFTFHFDDLGMIELNGQVIQSNPEQTSYISPGLVHRELIGKRPSRYVALFILEDILNNVAMEYNRSLKNLPPLHRFPTPAGILDTLKVFMEESRRELPGKNEILNSITLQVAHTLVRNLFDIGSSDSIQLNLISENFHINKAIEFIYKNLDKKITIEQLASVANLSASHFTSVFRKEMDESPYRYILLTRLYHAKQMLDEGKESLVKIALACGFSSSSHFTSAFHKEFSIPPSEYKKKIKV